MTLWSDGRDYADCLCDEIDPADVPCLVCVCVVLKKQREPGHVGMVPWSNLPGLNTPLSTIVIAGRLCSVRLATGTYGDGVVAANVWKHGQILDREARS